MVDGGPALRRQRAHCCSACARALCISRLHSSYTVFCLPACLPPAGLQLWAMETKKVDLELMPRLEEKELFKWVASEGGRELHSLPISARQWQPAPPGFDPLPPPTLPPADALPSLPPHTPRLQGLHGGVQHCHPAPPQVLRPRCVSTGCTGAGCPVVRRALCHAPLPTSLLHSVPPFLGLRSLAVHVALVAELYEKQRAAKAARKGLEITAVVSRGVPPLGGGKCPPPPLCTWACHSPGTTLGRFAIT